MTKNSRSSNVNSRVVNSEKTRFRFHDHKFLEAVIFTAVLLMPVFGSAAGNGILQKPAVAEKQLSAELWLTKTDGSALFQKQPDTIRFAASTAASSTAININPDVKYQEMDGFGCALTGGSAKLMHNMPGAERGALIKELFGTDGNAIGLSYLRISVGASDLDEKVFSYDDLPRGQSDPELAKFSIEPDRTALIPVLKEILTASPALKLLASPWSPPAWMKTNGSPKGGSLKPEYYAAYAGYLTKYVKAMREEGINIDALTIQNEPLNPDNNPSMFMPAETQELFIKKYLGPAFKKSGLKTKIIVYDHNCDRPEYPLSILADKEALQYVAGSAFHLYAGELTAMSMVHDARPDKGVYFTEQWVGGPSNFRGDFMWHLGTLMVGAVRNWSRTVLEWNLASDPDYGPHTDGGCVNCQGAITIAPDGVRRDVAYYVLAHVSKFVRPGSVRLGSNLPPLLPNAAFKTASGEIILIVLNESTAPADFSIRYRGEAAAVTLPGGAAGTYVIRSHKKSDKTDF